MRAPLLLLALASPAAAEGPSVLLMGNSYTQFNDLDAILADVLRASTPGADRPLTLKLVAGGLTLKDHLDRLDPSTGSPAWQSALGPEASWDAVLLQDQSQIPGFPETEPLWLASRDAAISLHERADAAGARSLLFLTWGRRLGDPSNPTMYPDFTTMQGRLTEGYRAYAAAMEAASGRQATLAPVGPAFAVVHDRILAEGADPLAAESAFSALYNADGSHPSPAGSYLAACVIAQTLTGWPTLGGSWDGPLDDSTRAYLQGVADGLVVEDPFGAWTWPWAWPWDAVVEPGTDPVSLGDPRMRLQVGVDSEIGEIGRLDLDDAALNILEGGAIRLPDVRDIGEDGGSVLILRGGSLEIGAVGLPVRLLSGRFDHQAGSSIAGDLTLEAGATWYFEAADEALQVAGGGRLAGSIAVEDPVEGLLLARFGEEPDLGDLQVQPADWQARLLPEDGVWKLILMEGEPTDSADPGGTDSGQAGQDDGGNGGNGDSGDGASGDGAPADGEAAARCGCGGGAAALPLFFGLLGLGAALRRRPAGG